MPADKFMDYLDHNKDARHRFILFTGYFLIAIAIAMGTIVLVYRAYGFGLNTDGSVTQNGLIFAASHPDPAKVYIDGKLTGWRTDAKLTIAEGNYLLTLKRDGYWDWQRSVEVEGGGVQRVDYPLLIPKTLDSRVLADLGGVPSLASQSPDQRWLLLGKPGNLTAFDLYDLKNPTKPATSLNLPASLLSPASHNQSWQSLAWADDNRHLLLKHTYDGKAEFILLDRTAPGQSLNLNKVFNVAATDIAFINRNFNDFYLYDGAQKTLQTASLSSPTPALLASQVTAIQATDSGLIIVTAKDAPKGQSLVQLRNGDHFSTITSLPADKQYLLAAAKYHGSLYVVVGASQRNTINIYKDPLQQLKADPALALQPKRILFLKSPKFVSFSPDGQFVSVENGQYFSVYDIDSGISYEYSVPHTLDLPGAQAKWMDNYRLTYVSHGILIEFDYDGSNRHSLMAANANSGVFFDAKDNTAYSVAPSPTVGSHDQLVQTNLLTKADR
ncbi:MAG TPA: PEGA domain-containing protein [Candidatus Saccharimonadales bacterium]|nr:PEGA domain-containing protein [Candidatus Saccharimonadales bacterium]